MFYMFLNFAFGKGNFAFSVLIKSLFMKKDNWVDSVDTLRNDK